MPEQNKHEFAVYLDSLSSLMASIPVGGDLCIVSEEIHHRITRVLRLVMGDELVLFDRATHVRGVLRTFRGKKEIDVQVVAKEHNAIPTPKITMIIPLLKRESFDAAVYAAVETGMNAIQLVTTQKAQRRWGGDKEFSRLQRVMISAAEQSKHFAFPELLSPIPFELFLDTVRVNAGPKFFFDPQGKPLLSIIYDVQKQLPQELILMVGPEGDLTPQEKNQLQDGGFTFCKLTSTILRAQQAVAIGGGLFRSIFP